MSVRCLDIGRVVIKKDNSRRQDDLTVNQVRHKPYFPIPEFAGTWGLQHRLTHVLGITFPNRWEVVRDLWPAKALPQLLTSSAEVCLVFMMDTSP